MTDITPPRAAEPAQQTASDEAMLNVTPQKASPQAAPARPAPSAAAQPAALTPLPPLPISSETRMLLGPSPYYDPADKEHVEQVFGTIARELDVSSTLQAIFAQDFAMLAHDQAELRRTIQTAIMSKYVAAAREVLCEGFSNFHPMTPTMQISAGSHTPAYKQFMDDGGDEVLELSDREAITRAIAKLAELGLPETALKHRAYILALDTIVLIEKLLATKVSEADATLERLFYLMDRRKARK